MGLFRGTGRARFAGKSSFLVEGTWPAQPPAPKCEGRAETLARYVVSGLSPAASREFRDHIEDCERCRQRLTEYPRWARELAQDLR